MSILRHFGACSTRLSDYEFHEAHWYSDFIQHVHLSLLLTLLAVLR